MDSLGVDSMAEVRRRPVVVVAAAAAVVQPQPQPQPHSYRLRSTRTTATDATVAAGARRSRNETTSSFWSSSGSVSRQRQRHGINRDEGSTLMGRPIASGSSNTNTNTHTNTADSRTGTSTNTNNENTHTFFDPRYKYNVQSTLDRQRALDCIIAIGRRAVEITTTPMLLSSSSTTTLLPVPVQGLTTNNSTKTNPSNNTGDHSSTSGNSSHIMTRPDKKQRISTAFSTKDAYRRCGTAMKQHWKLIPKEWKFDGDDKTKEFILTLLQTTAILPASRPFLPSQSEFERRFPIQYQHDRAITLAWTYQQDFPRLYQERKLYLPAVFASDPHVCYQYCKQIRRALTDCSYETICDDADIVRAAVSLDGMELQYASSRLQQQYEVVRLACTNDGRALGFCPPYCDAHQKLLVDRNFLIQVILPSKPPTIRDQTKASGTVYRGPHDNDNDNHHGTAAHASILL